MINWSVYKKFDGINEKYLPNIGEGETMATQLVTAVNRLVYKWYNDGDVYDNTCYLEGWCNDVSDCANWIYKYIGYEDLLEMVFEAGESEYESILFELANETFDEEYLEQLNEKPAVGSIYDCKGLFQFVEQEDEEEEW